MKNGKLWLICGTLALAIGAWAQTKPAKPTTPQPTPKQEKPKSTPPPGVLLPPGVKMVRRSRPLCPVRLGGVFVMGLGDDPDPYEESAKNGTQITEENRKFLTQWCDIVALPPTSLAPDTLRIMAKEQETLRPLLLLSASTLQEKEGASGSVGGWRPEMQAWTLRDAAGNEIAHPDKGAHWMDFGNAMWAEHWKAQTLQLIAKYGAVGVVASELPLGNSEVTDNLANLQKYKTREDLAEATLQWLQRVRAPGAYWLLPSAIGFDDIVGHPTSPLEDNLAEPALIGRYWDHFAPFIDGAWSEGWVQPYWSEFGLPSEVRDMHIAAGNRASRNGQLLIATAAYRNDSELETLLAHYLLVSHKQGDFVFQPMPIQAGAPPEAGLSLKVFREEVKRKAAYLQIPLGSSLDEKLYVKAENGAVWKRRFQNGMVYLNPSDSHAVRLNLGGGMRRIGSTEIVRELELAPRSGVILLFTETSGTKK